MSAETDNNLARSEPIADAQPSETKERQSRAKAPESVVDAILDALRGVKFGQVTVTVQDGHVVQIERLERRRLKT